VKALFAGVLQGSGPSFCRKNTTPGLGSLIKRVIFNTDDFLCCVIFSIFPVEFLFSDRVISIMEMIGIAQPQHAPSVFFSAVQSQRRKCPASCRYRM
jgi:hypothetical protein